MGIFPALQKLTHMWGQDNFLWLVVQAFFAFFLTWLVSRACLDLILLPARHLFNTALCPTFAR